MFHADPVPNGLCCTVQEADGIGHVAGPFGVQISSSAPGRILGGFAGDSLCFLVPKICGSLVLEFWGPLYEYYMPHMILYDIII